MALKISLTLLLVMLLWLPFRATDLDHSAALFQNLFQWSPVSVPDAVALIAPVLSMSSADSPPLAVLLWALRFEGLEEILAGLESPRYPTLRAAVLRGYSSVRPLPEECGAPVASDVVVEAGVATTKQTRATVATTAATTAAEEPPPLVGSWPALPLLDTLVAHRDLVVMAWFAATDVAFLRPRVAEMANATLRRIRAWVPPPA